MRILVAHNHYQCPGGEDAVVRDEIDLLRSHGHRVDLLEQDNEGIRGFRGNFIASTSVFYSSHSRMRMRAAIHGFRPDILHVHNWFPMLSPSIILEADASGISVVQTLHNFRMICANGLLYRKGSVCTDCIGKSFPVDGILHGCYRGSRIGSAVVTSAYAYHRLAHTWDHVDLFIAVSNFQREVLVRGGLPPEKLVVKPNFVIPPIWNSENKACDYALFVGRLSPEKGIKTLLDAWNSGIPPLRLKICGDGPMSEEVRSAATKNTSIEYLGLQPPEMVYHEMANAKFLVFPSEWYETFGRTVVEAFSQGTPVLAADLGGIRELVEDRVTGFLFPPGNVDALIAGATRFPSGESYEKMRLDCRKVFLSKFTAEINYTLLSDIYSRALEIRKQRGQAL
jgi:glycosyltransferase involved in cell wall biosynthesis